MIEDERKERSRLATSQQYSASNPNESVWVEASAGTGKTKVLSDRVLRLLLNSKNPHPERILCLTYTKAGAVEMKSRIFERLSEWSVINDESLQKNLIELFSGENLDYDKLKEYKKRARTLFALLLDTPGGIKIQTIHSFCQDILSRFPLEAGVSPYFEVMETEEEDDILAQIRKELITEAENNPQSPVAKYMQYITENMKEGSFTKALKKIIENKSKLQNIFLKYPDYSDFEHHLALKLQAFPDKLIADFYNEFKISATPLIKKAIEILHHGTNDENKKANALQKIVDSDFSAQNFPALQKLILTQKNTVSIKGTADSKKYNPQIVEIGQNLADMLNETLKKITRQKLFFASQAIFGLAHKLFSSYAEYKQKQAKLDYEDLIFATNRLLSNSSTTSWVLYKLDGGIDHILIDEAQDTSPEQWNIIKSLSEEFFAGIGSKKEPCTVFVVGDRKQSIFSFQGADPQKMEEMSAYFSAKANSHFTKINLDVSFRSTSAVLDIVNKIFSVSEASAGVVCRGEKVNHLPYRLGEFGKVEIWPLLVKEKNKSSDDETDDNQSYLTQKRTPSLKYQLAQKIVAKIKELMQKSANSPRPIHFGDFMVLVQKRAHFLNEFIRACKEENVNVSGADRMKLSEQIAVQDLISLAKVLLLPNDDLSLAEVLKSPLFNLNDDDLFKLCYNRGGANLWSKLKDFSEYAETYQTLQTLFNMVDFVRPFELFDYVLTKMNGRKKFILRMGYEVEDALDEFMNLILDFEKEHIPSLQNFVEWVENHDLEIKRESKQNDVDAVRLMTAHGSKGLQARIVFLPDTTIDNAVKNEQKLLINENTDTTYFPFNKDFYEDCSKEINQYLSKKEAEERRRLLYVALTRAEDELYICGYSGSAKGASADSWYGLCRSALEKVGELKSDGTLIYEIGGEIKAPKKTQTADNYTYFEPEEWIFTEAKPENALSKPYTPSKLDDGDDTDSVSPLADKGDYFKRGTIIHKMLQFLPKTLENQLNVAKKYLAQTDFSLSEQKQISDEVCAVLNNPEFTDIFGPYSRAEVPVMGEVKGRIISAQIDRLIIMPDRIKIVDFKTNRRVDEIPPEYINQLNVYAELIGIIYPNKPIETYLLWTNQLKLTRIA